MLISELGLSARAERCLKRNSITTVSELSTKSATSLLLMRGLGNAAALEITTAMIRAGFPLKAHSKTEVLPPGMVLDQAIKVCLESVHASCT